MKKVCFITECGLNARSLSLCEKHYAQIKKHGHIFNDDELAQMRKAKHANRRQPSGWTWPEESKKALSNRFMGRTLNSGRTHFKKGLKSWNSGKKDWMSEEHKNAIIKANTGNTYTRGVLRPGTSKENNPNWKGGITSASKLDRQKFQKNTQRLIFNRDNYTCEVCKQYGGYLQVDHIKSWAEFPELRFDHDNCRTLCMACHYYVTFKRKMPQGTIWGHNLSRRIAS